jgi:signal transduction histidine kinase
VTSIEAWNRQRKWLGELAAIGIDPTTLPPDDMRRVRVVSLTTVAMCVLGLVSCVQFLRMSMPLTAAAVAGAVAAGLANLLVLRAWPQRAIGGHLAMGVYAAIIAITSAAVGGYYSPNFSWLYTIPLCATVVVGLRGGIIWTALTTVMLFAFWSLPEWGIELQNNIPPAERHGNALFTRALALAAVAGLGASFVTAQRRAERELARTSEERRREKAYVELIMHAAVSANQASSFDEAMRESLQRIVDAMGWLGGHVCTVREDGSTVSSGIYHVVDPERYQSLIRATIGRGRGPGEGIAGRAVQYARAEYVEHLQEDDPRGRAALANSLGFRSAFAVPIFANGKIPAVLEFVSCDPLPDVDGLIRVFTHIGVQLGRVMEREAVEDRLRQAQKLEAVGQLAAGIAHEINNPMSYVRSNLHSLRKEWDALARRLEAAREAGDASTDRLGECRELIEESLEGVERTIAIVRDVRELSHSGGAQPSERERVDLTDVLAGALRVSAAQAPGGISFVAELDVSTFCVCSTGQLRQVFVNLIVNAIQAVGKRGEIRLSAERDGREVVLRVADDVEGMTAATHERLFDPFFTTKPVGEGTGLGLSVSYEIIRSHDGQIQVTSEPGEGAAFEIRLPAADVA